MPVTVSYPGLYIEELPSNSHTVTSAATSIAVFIGYTHPFKTQTFNTPIRLFSYADFEFWFGGLYQNDVFPSFVSYAVNEFFLNGGADCYVVGLSPQYHKADGTSLGSAAAPAGTLATTGGGIAFTGLEPADTSHPLTVTVTKARPAGTLDHADVVITYGAQAETYRNVAIGNDPTALPSHLANLINGKSRLVTVAKDGTDWGTAFTTASDMRVSLAEQTPADFDHVLASTDFTTAFADEGLLDKLAIFNLLILPGVTDFTALSEALSFAEKKRSFLIMDPPPDLTADSGGSSISTYFDTPPKGENGAIYYPWVATKDPLSGNDLALPPSGYVAGIYARTDTNRGVWKAPAGLEATLLDAVGVVESGRMTDNFAGVLNNAGVNALRVFPGVGTVVFGARTLVSTNVAFEQWKYVSVRRMALFIEQSLLRSLGWAVMEPNDTPLWTALRTTVEAFMLGLFQQGALAGDTPSKAFKVVCDSTTTTPTDVANGTVNILVAFAPLKPAEFVVIQIAQLAGQAQG